MNLYEDNMKLIQTTYFNYPYGQPAAVTDGTTTGYHFEYHVRKPGDLLEIVGGQPYELKEGTYRRWTIMAHTLNIMQVAPGLNKRRLVKTEFCGSITVYYLKYQVIGFIRKASKWISKRFQTRL